MNDKIMVVQNEHGRERRHTSLTPSDIGPRPPLFLLPGQYRTSKQSFRVQEKIPPRPEE